MRTQIAYALIAFLGLAAVLLLARLRTRKASRPKKKHLRIDLLPATREGGPQAAVNPD